VIRVVRAEWLKLRTTAVPWVLTGIAVLALGLTILGLFLQKPDFNQSSNAGYIVPHTTQQLNNLAGAGLSFGYLFALLLGVLCITTEFRHKTVTTAFLVTPNRPVFVVGKLILAALAGAALAVVLLVATLTGGGLALVARGGSFSSLLHQVPSVAPGMILVMALFGILGVGVGSLLTNQVAAIVTVLGWFIIGQTILVGLVNGAARWVPTGAASAAANVSQGHRDGAASFQLFNWWQGTLLMLAYGLVFAVIGSAVLTQRDIS
jgi:ABC-type transport system involved in multi-copper enzyme maturation permease subunit